MGGAVVRGPGRIAAEAIADRAYEARKLAIARHFALIRELIGQRHEVRCAKLTAETPGARAALDRREAELDARIILLQGGSP